VHKYFIKVLKIIVFARISPKKLDFSNIPTAYEFIFLTIRYVYVHIQSIHLGGILKLRGKKRGIRNYGIL